MSSDHPIEDLAQLKKYVESDEPLFKCEPCGKVGFEVEAILHKTQTGHDCERATDEEASEAREIWREELRAKGVDVQ